MGILNTLTHVLHTAEQQPNADYLLTNARLYPDMYPVSDQVRLATQFSENIVARLTNREPVNFDHDLGSYSKCYERIETVLKSVKEADKKTVNALGDSVSPTPMGPGKPVDMSEATYAHIIALPNIYFHLTTAYGILRKEGVPLGKMDYYAGFAPIAIHESEVLGKTKSAESS
ncbi:conserved hypothetical protein [Talaromyces stipitatus ATCC 10500]|uniref:DUF1993 domain-containing protein n=1 Tax=Talaromyces stipitatus (strain ATCC 10500 / CBS 375.48 / QM 6759 / NRRL 1006) TaxID=441959 RepID=B8MR89_TALSN|nr:uncharacterized protein TSTA_054930 [Talaromyces stipitatus ATCC 10500]EED12984.1 conserved hypothetical protein [Talaromyces stipitatus ATCC 10500]